VPFEVGLPLFPNQFFFYNGLISSNVGIYTSALKSEAGIQKSTINIHVFHGKAHKKVTERGVLKS
jgi:hypothetical protein